MVGLCLIHPNLLSSQHSEVQKKVKIIETTVDENGNVSEIITELEGKDAEKYINNQHTEEDISIEKEVQVEVESNSKNESGYTINVDENGKKKSMHWDGTGEMPEEMKKYIDENDININIVEETKNEKIKIKIIDKAGEVKVMEWTGEGEMPEEMKEFMIKNEIQVDSKSTINNKEKEDKKIEWRGENKTHQNQTNNVDSDWYTKNRTYGYYNPDKATLGVSVEEKNGKVIVVKVVKNSPAERAGLAAGDIITKVDNTEIDNVDRLVSKIGTFKPGDKTRIYLDINGQKKKTNVTF